MNSSPNFAIFNQLPPDSRVYLVVGDRGTYAYVGGSYDKPTRADSVEESVRDAVRRLLDIAADYEKSESTAIYAATCRASACRLYERDVEARVELTGDLEGLVLSLGLNRQGHRSNVLEDEWVFTDMHYETPNYSGPTERIRCFKLASEFVAGLKFVPAY